MIRIRSNNYLSLPPFYQKDRFLHERPNSIYSIFSNIGSSGAAVESIEGWGRTKFENGNVVLMYRGIPVINWLSSQGNLTATKMDGLQEVGFKFDGMLLQQQLKQPQYVH